ncbi:7-carboxy-7-deazaguanine synthase QueE [Tepidiforma sp.]|uniref:7-carboxy-7-deazaguanine synthase QueE n=1 Tax=Tepidiforma sp. TaxID=2682230 RepID=UPI0021DDD427|nr:7-carboxy-7-deazaguanine synthase QueE [Tepidiforma sp.]MCX7619002.1 7-carboxy-7-deazaguanine synthase QueE [Tepidiforma sp.]GIW18758.1 MAG: radical SAM protein [Tepidiforma sp.]
MERLVLARTPEGGPEIFASIQGEGVSMGLPSTFVRLAICNLRCRWCDTAYTWDWARFERAASTLVLAADDVAEAVRALPPRNVVVTGGEPLLQRRQLVPLIAALRAEGYRFEVETNGTVGPGPLAGLIDQFNVSPKLAHSGNEGLRRIAPAALRELAATGRAWFKFVVAEPADLAEVREVCAAAEIAPGRVVLMPEGTSAAVLAERGRWLAELCARDGYRFSTRLHILLWGDRRGV